MSTSAPLHQEPPAAAVGSWAPPELEHEQLLVRRGSHTGEVCLIAVHSTVLGPALGGCRMWPYPSLRAAVDDVLRLSSAMTLKAAAAGLSLGGGKGVISLSGPAPPGSARRRDVLHDFGDAVQSLGGAYVTAEDVGTDVRDMELVAARTRHVAGLPADRGGSGDPAPFTAAGVHAAMRACARHAFGSPALAGRRVAVLGCGHVGSRLARRLAAEGAALLLSDPDPARRAELEGLGEWAEPREALEAEVDVLAPCALGGVLDRAAAAGLRAPVVCGAANNQLADDTVADELHARGILYAPDFIVNAGGIINISLEAEGYDPAQAERRVLAIEQVMGGVLEHARATGLTPLAGARELALRRLASAGGR